MEKVQPLAYSVSDLCVVLKLSKQSIYDEINSGRLRSYKAHGRRLASHDAALEYIQAREAETLESVAS